MLEVLFQPSTNFDILIAELSLLGYESFWESDEGLRAYIEDSLFEKKELIQLLAKYNHQWEFHLQSTEPDEWDVSKKDKFEPIIIANQCLIKGSNSSFKANVPHTLIVDAHLAFGSGHHPSTHLCLEAQLTIDFKGKNVIDIGCGTATLALLAEKLGAKFIDAIDNNPWAIEVAERNLILNQSTNIRLQALDTHTAKLNTPYDIILGNLNEAVLKTELQHFPALLKSNGYLLLSGFMQKDATWIHEIALANQLIEIKKFEKEDWIAKIYQKK